MHTDFILRGLGRHAPDRILTNADLETMVETSDEWITTRTGIRQRHIVSPGEGCTDLAYGAAKMALQDAGIEADDLTHILLATYTSDYVIPQGACVLEEKLGVKGKIALDVSAACSGFLFALETARGFVALDRNAKVLVVASEVNTHRANFTDRATCVLFGDAAGAVVVTAGDPEDGPRVLDVKLGTDGGLGDLLTVKGGGSMSTYKEGEPVRDDYFIQMQGREVYKHAVRNMTGVCKEILERNNLSVDDVNVLLPHQANLRIIEAVGKKLGVPEEKVYVNVDRYGNTSAASVPLALSEARDNGFIKKGDLVLLTTFGGGFTWGAALVRF